MRTIDSMGTAYARPPLGSFQAETAAMREWDRSIAELSALVSGYGRKPKPPKQTQEARRPGRAVHQGAAPAAQEARTVTPPAPSQSASSGTGQAAATRTKPTEGRKHLRLTSWYGDPLPEDLKGRIRPRSIWERDRNAREDGFQALHAIVGFPLSIAKARLRRLREWRGKGKK